MKTDAYRKSGGGANGRFRYPGRLSPYEAKLEYDGWTGKTSIDSSAKMDHREDSGRLGANLGLFHGALKNTVAASFASHERDYMSSI